MPSFLVEALVVFYMHAFETLQNLFVMFSTIFTNDSMQDYIIQII